MHVGSRKFSEKICPSAQAPISQGPALRSGQGSKIFCVSVGGGGGRIAPTGPLGYCKRAQEAVGAKAQEQHRLVSGPHDHGQRCIRRKGTPEAAPEAVRQAVGGGCRSGWGRLLSVTLSLALGVRGTVARHRLGAVEEGGGGCPLPLHCIADHGSRSVMRGGREERQWTGPGQAAAVVMRRRGGDHCRAAVPPGSVMEPT